MECFLQRHLPAAEFSRNIVDNADRIQVRTAARNPLNYSHGILLGIVQCDHDSGGRHIGLCRLEAGDSQHPLDRVLDPVNLRPVLEHQLPGQGRCVQIQFIIFLFLHFFPLQLFFFKKAEHKKYQEHRQQYREQHSQNCEQQKQNRHKDQKKQPFVPRMALIPLFFFLRLLFCPFF